MQKENSELTTIFIHRGGNIASDHLGSLVANSSVSFDYSGSHFLIMLAKAWLCSLRVPTGDVYLVEGGLGFWVAFWKKCFSRKGKIVVMAVDALFNHRNRSKITNAFLRRAFRQIDATLPVSQLVAKDAAKYNERIPHIVVPHFIDTTAFASVSADHSKKHILFMINRPKETGETKGLRFALDIFTALRKKDPAWHLYIIGEGTEKLSVADNQIHLEGSQNPAQYLKHCPIVIVPAQYEAFSLAAAEAAVAGALPLMSPTVGARELVRKNIADFVIDPKDVQGCVERILSFYQLPESKKIEVVSVAKQAAVVYTKEHSEQKMRQAMTMLGDFFQKKDRRQTSVGSQKNNQQKKVHRHPLLLRLGHTIASAVYSKKYKNIFAVEAERNIFDGEVRQNIVWPNGTKAALNIQFDDLCAKSAQNDRYDFGGEPSAGINSAFEHFLAAHPEIKVTLFAIPNPAFSNYRGIFYRSSRQQKMLTHSHLAWFKTKASQVEIACHGYSHVSSKFPLYLAPAEFEFITRDEAHAVIEKSLAIFSDAGIQVKGFRPPAFGVGENADFGLVEALKEGQFSYVSLTSPYAGLNWSKKRLSNVYPEYYQGLLNIPQTISLSWDMDRIKDAIDTIVSLGGVITIMGHYQAEYDWMEDGIGEINFTKLEEILSYIETEHGDVIWHTTLAELADFWHNNEHENSH